uniref:RING-type domain-containing protein n=1 Tax=Leptocylindrus danicus TaxID=163516 RepID=A0A7S2KL76_9STRA|mmetsp:Transcript_23822/g.35771  ORF Transcript_23822/g.35771 Transcript_23822/m.35771 type:complete len:580 (+) Transcript_23822:189-1928(+)
MDVSFNISPSSSIESALMRSLDLNNSDEIPCHFVVLQGMEGDGLYNTIDPLKLDEHMAVAGASEQSNNPGITTEHHEEEESSPSSSPSSSNIENSGILVCPTQGNVAATTNDDFVHVDGEGSQQDVHSARSTDSLCGSSHHDVLIPRSNSNSLVYAPSSTQPYRDEKTGKLLLYSFPPAPFVASFDKQQQDPMDEESRVIGAISPGVRVLGLSLHDAVVDRPTLASNLLQFSLQQLASEQDESVGGCSKLSIANVTDAAFLRVRLENGQKGYVFYRFDHYTFLTPIKNNMGEEYSDWNWRVTYRSGAYVRDGLELNSKQVAVLPFGSFVSVKQKTINAMGLSRLKIKAKVSKTSHGSEDSEVVEGWISEKLNPLSGQSGAIVKSLPFHRPLAFKVILAEGAVIRNGVELSSREIRTVPCDTSLRVICKEFTESPMDKCIERLKLAGDGGYISLRLNRPPPSDVYVCECVSEDIDFDPERPEDYHSLVASEGDSIRAAAVKKRRGNNTEVSNTSSADKDTQSYDKKCLICLIEERSSTIVHGETGHIACCLACARILKARGDRCPVCRLPIDSVIQHFFA